MKYFKISLLAFAVLFFVLNFIDYNIIEEKPNPFFKEKFNPALIRLNSLEKLEVYVDSIAATQNTFIDTLDYAIIAKNVISERFYHNYSSQNLNENWIASVTQKITGLYLSSKITADDILTKPYGYCGQQNMVLYELLNKKGLNCRVVYLSKHFAMESFINGKWCFFDSNLEPDIAKHNRYDQSWLRNKDSLAAAYRKDTNWVSATFGNPVEFRYGKVNEVQGRHAQDFQKITKPLSRIAFIFPLFWFVYLSRKSRIKTYQDDTKNTKQAA